MLKFEIRNLDGVLREIQAMKEPLLTAAKEGLLKAMKQVAQDARSNVDSTFSKNSTGRLRSAIEAGVTEEGGALTGFVRVDEKTAPYASAQEWGATIRPRRSKYLTVPLRGTPRQPASTFPNTFVRRVHEKLFLFQKNGKNIRALFVLKKEVKIPKRPFMEPALEKNRDAILETVEREIDRVFSNKG